MFLSTVIKVVVLPNQVIFACLWLTGIQPVLICSLENQRRPLCVFGIRYLTLRGFNLYEVLCLIWPTCNAIFVLQFRPCTDESIRSTALTTFPQMITVSCGRWKYPCMDATAMLMGCFHLVMRIWSLNLDWRYSNGVWIVIIIFLRHLITLDIFRILRQRQFFAADCSQRFLLTSCTWFNWILMSIVALAALWCNSHTIIWL